MDQVKIGHLIATLRKEKKLTQNELASLLGVTDKSVSKWENGKCLPDVSLYKPLCELLGITLNEFFSGEKIPEENYKQMADENLLNALNNSVFTIKEKVEYFKEKWQKEHFLELTLVMLIIVFFIIFGFIKDNGLQYVFMIIGFIIGVIENNRRMAYIEKKAYGKKEKISMDEFRTYMQRMKEFKEIMSKFDSKEEAIKYLIKETGLSKQECEKAYDFILRLDVEKIK